MWTVAKEKCLQASELNLFYICVKKKKNVCVWVEGCERRNWTEGRVMAGYSLGSALRRLSFSGLLEAMCEKSLKMSWYVSSPGRYKQKKQHEP